MWLLLVISETDRGLHTTKDENIGTDHPLDRASAPLNPVNEHPAVKLSILAAERED